MLHGIADEEAELLDGELSGVIATGHQSHVDDAPT